MKIDRKKVYDKYNGHCAYCGCEITIKQMQVDHVIAKRSGIGSKMYGFEMHHEDNLHPACRQCNFYKSTFTINEFRKQLFTLHERIQKPFINRLGEKYGIVTIKPFDGKFYFELIEGKDQP